MSDLLRTPEDYELFLYTLTEKFPNELFPPESTCSYPRD